MNGDGFMRYNWGSLDELAGNIDGRVNAVQTLIDDLRAKIENLSALYEGTASEGFTKTRNDWNNAANHLTQVLAKIRIAVVKTREDAMATEQRNTSRW